MGELPWNLKITKELKAYDILVSRFVFIILFFYGAYTLGEETVKKEGKPKNKQNSSGNFYKRNKKGLKKGEDVP